MTSIIEKRQQRAALVNELGKLNKFAASEQRELTIEEREKWNGWERECLRLEGEIARDELQERREGDLAQASDRNSRGGNPGEQVEEISEDRILKPNQSVRSYLQSRGMIRQPDFEKLRFGAFLRSMITGGQNDLERRALSEGTDSAGGFSVPNLVLLKFIDRLRAATVTIRAGAKTVVLDSDKTTLVRIATDPAAGWRAENAAIDIVDNTYEGVVFIPRSLAVLVKASRELVEDSVNIEEMLEAAFLGSLSTELDRAALVGSGVAPEPLGISGTTGVGSVASGGALVSYDKIIDGMHECWKNNSPVVNAIIMAPRTYAGLAKLKDTTNAPLARPEVLKDTAFLQTTSLPINETPGTASRIILGDFSQLMIGIRTSLRIEVLRELFAGNLQYGFLAHLRADIGLAHPESFARITGILP